LTWNGHTFASSIDTTVHLTNAVGCDSAATLHLTIACSSTLNLALNIQGYYDLDAHAMRPVMLNQGAGSSSTVVDTITVDLHDGSSYATIASVQAVLNTDGTVTAVLPPVTGSYYIGIRYKNTIETWSTNPVSFTSGATTSYSFTSGSGQAMGHNMIEVESGVWAIYSGELNADGNIDLSDYTIWGSDFNNFAYGYVPTDLNGDGNVDLTDYTIWESNFNNFIGAVHP
jgi:hypothetical protein